MRAIGGEEGFELFLRLGLLAGAIGVDRGVELLPRRVGEVDPGPGDGRRAGNGGRREGLPTWADGARGVHIYESKQDE